MSGGTTFGLFAERALPLIDPVTSAFGLPNYLQGICYVDPADVLPAGSVADAPMLRAVMEVTGPALSGTELTHEGAGFSLVVYRLDSGGGGGASALTAGGAFGGVVRRR